MRLVHAKRPPRQRLSPDRKSVHYRHADIQKQQFWLSLFNDSKSFLTVACFKNCISTQFQQLAEQFSVDCIVFGNEDFDHGCPADFARLWPRTTLPTSAISCSFQEPSFCSRPCVSRFRSAISSWLKFLAVITRIGSSLKAGSCRTWRIT